MNDFQGFVYLDIRNPMVAWNTVRGYIASSSCLPGDESKSFISFNMAGLLSGSDFRRLRSEIEIERIRQSNFSNQVSRLTGLFVFNDAESVSQTWIERGWGGHFDLENLTDVGVASNRLSRVDANWLMKMMDCNCDLLPCAEEMIHRYWNGEAVPDEIPIWECIVEGWMTVWGRRVRSSALDEIKRYWPKSLKLLEYSVNAARMRSADGGVYPRSYLKGSDLCVEYYIRMKDASDANFLKNMSKYFKKNPHEKCWITPDTEIVLPDFTMYNIKRALSPEDERMFPAS